MPLHPSDRHPLLYQINTRILLSERSRDLGRPATLDDVPDALLDDMRALGFRWLWFLGLWQTGAAARAISLSDPGLREGYARELPDFRAEDVCGSPFAIQAYHTHSDFGGDGALARLRGRMERRGLKLMADFVVNHCAPDHAWVASHPEFFIHGDEGDLQREPQNWTRLLAGPDRTESILAHGRDPYFPGWPDTLQLNLLHPGCRRALKDELLRIADRCDGVRCDMAMLAQADIIGKTWGDRARPRDGLPPEPGPFWPDAIAGVRAAHPGFLFLAEVYWDRERELQGEGFDFTYDKKLYDHLLAGSAAAVREHVAADPGFQARSLHFLENHDEARATRAFPNAMHRAAAVLNFFIPGMRLFQEGQLSGRMARASVHLNRRPAEAAHPGWESFYAVLLACLRGKEVHAGIWKPAEVLQAWKDDPTWNQFTAFSWRLGNGHARFAVINYGPERGRCFAKFDVAGLGLGWLRLKDTLSEAEYVRSAIEIAKKGMYFDMPEWGYHLFELKVQAPIFGLNQA